MYKILIIAEGAEHPIVETDPARLLEKVRADIFPYDLAFLCHFEDAAVTALADQRVAVDEALRPGDVRAEEFEDRLVGVSPHDLAGARIDLDDSREGDRAVMAMGAVVEDQDVAVRQGPRVVLLRQGRAVDLPHDVAGGALDHHDRRNVAEADQDIALGGLRDGVAVGPLIAEILRGDRVALGLEMFPTAPLPDDLA